MNCAPPRVPLRRQFPAADGRSLRQVASAAHRSVQLTAATGVYTPGVNRYAFGLSDSANRFIYAPSAVYIARSPNAPAAGPFLAPADPLAVAPRYRSEQNDPDAVKAVYDAQLPLAQPGVYAILVLTRTPRGLIASSSEVAVASSLPIPGVGQRPPAIATDTLASVHGDVKLLSTRIPPDDMHAVSFDQVLGKRPIALLFSTPALCVSRVCGPVTDIMVQLEHEFGGRIAFIHEEVYVGNDPSKGPAAADERLPPRDRAVALHGQRQGRNRGAAERSVRRAARRGPRSKRRCAKGRNQQRATSSPSATCSRIARGSEKSRKTWAPRPTRLETTRAPTCMTRAPGEMIERSISTPSITRSGSDRGVRADVGVGDLGPLADHDRTDDHAGGHGRRRIDLDAALDPILRAGRRAQLRAQAGRAPAG